MITNNLAHAGAQVGKYTIERRTFKNLNPAVKIFHVLSNFQKTKTDR